MLKVAKKSLLKKHCQTFKFYHCTTFIYCLEMCSPIMHKYGNAVVPVKLLHRVSYVSVE
jgi:hypothetical protein